MNTLRMLWTVWTMRRIPGALSACLRILAWPPSRKRFDKIVNGKGDE